MRHVAILAGLLCLSMPAWGDVPASTGQAVIPAATTSQSASDDLSQYEALLAQARAAYARAKKSLYHHGKWQSLRQNMDGLITLHDKLQGNKPLDPVGREETAWLYLVRAKARFYAEGWKATGPSYEDMIKAREAIGMVPADHVPDIMWELGGWSATFQAAIPDWGEKGKSYPKLSPFYEQFSRPVSCPKFTYTGMPRGRVVLYRSRNWIANHRAPYVVQVGVISFDYKADGRLENLKLRTETPYPIAGESWVKAYQSVRAVIPPETPEACLKNNATAWEFTTYPYK